MLHWAAQMPTWDLHWETGMYPGETLAFLALCDVTGAVSIIESGRGLHGYSTQVLGEYAERTGTQVVSVCLENSPQHVASVRRTLSRYRQVECLTGDIWKVLPRVAARLPGPMALVLDGPKQFEANRVSLLASALFPIVAVGQHNSDPGLAFTEEFARFFPGAYHYEDLLLADSAEWATFKRWEREAVKGYELPGRQGRSLSRSSMVLAAIPPGRRPASSLFAVEGTGARIAAFTTLMKWHLASTSPMRRKP